MIIVAVFIFFFVYPTLSMNAEESSVMGGKIRASIGPQTANREQAASPNPVSEPMTTPSLPQGFPVLTPPQPATRAAPAPAVPDVNPPINAPSEAVLSADSIKDPTESEIYQSIQEYILNGSRSSGMLEIFDPQLSKNRKLIFLTLGGPSQKIGNIFRSLVKFQDVNTAEIVDLNFDMQFLAGQVNVISVMIFRVNGEEWSANNMNIPFGGAGVQAPVQNQLPLIFTNPNNNIPNVNNR